MQRRPFKGRWPDCSGNSRFPRLAEPTSDGLNRHSSNAGWLRGDPGSMVQSMPSSIALWGCPPAHRRTMSSQLIVRQWAKTCSHRPFPCSCRLGAARNRPVPGPGTGPFRRQFWGQKVTPEQTRSGNPWVSQSGLIQPLDQTALCFVINPVFLFIWIP